MACVRRADDELRAVFIWPVGPTGCADVALLVGQARAAGAAVLDAAKSGWKRPRDIPPDTLNRASAPGQHFGYPYCHGGTIADPEFGSRKPCSAFTAPAQRLGPHVAALGMRFYTGAQFPPRYRGQIFVAEHGSWNRTQKIGYRVTLVTLDAAGNPVAYEPFAEGWLQGESAWGRPADVQVAPDGSLLIADDTAGAIYRVRYRGSAR